jgi:hypothetical protein
MELETGSKNGQWQRRLFTRTAVALALCASAFVAGEVRAQERETTREEIREEVRETHWQHPRFRFGASGEGGGFFGAVHGGVGGLAIRAGVQFNDLVGLYVQGHGLIGELLPDPRPTTVVGFAFHELMIDVTLLDMLQLGAGPSLDFFWGCNETNGGAVCGRSGAFFGGDFRAAILVGSHGPGRRSGLVFSIDAHPTWLDHELSTTMLFGIGGEMF